VDSVFFDERLPVLPDHTHFFPVVLLHQDAFVADYQEDEYALLGMAI